MADQQKNDEMIDKVLAALKGATPPEGMEARIAQQLQHHAQAQGARFRLRDLFANSTLTGTTTGAPPEVLTKVWWRGALVGAAVAMLVVCAMLLLQHRSQASLSHMQFVAGNSAGIGNAAPTRTSSATPADSHRTPCAGPSLMRVRNAVATPRVEPVPPATPASFERSHPAPSEPLTVEERELLHLARTANPSELAALNPENEAKLEAQEAAEFNKFFTPPQPPPQPSPESRPDDAKSTDNPAEKKPADDSTETKGEL